MDFSIRSNEEELMDDLECEGPVVDQTLRELNTINTLLGGNQISVNAFKKTASQMNGEIRLVDVGCGGGDILKVLAKWCRKQGLTASFIGVDANPNIIRYAAQNCREYPEISFRCVNILDKGFYEIDFNVVHACLFTHHFSTQQLIRLFERLQSLDNVRVLVNDLHRHPLAYHSIKILTRLFSKSEMVRYDAAVSVLRGFKKRELVEILKEANVTSFSLKWAWAFRWKLIF